MFVFNFSMSSVFTFYFRYSETQLMTSLFNFLCVQLFHVINVYFLFEIFRKKIDDIVAQLFLNNIQNFNYTSKRLV
jgi:hypothetical protein